MDDIFRNNLTTGSNQRLLNLGRLIYLTKPLPTFVRVIPFANIDADATLVAALAT